MFGVLGKQGWARLRQGDEAGAETAFINQTRIFRGNPGPYVSLAMFEAQRGNEDAAMAHLRDAVLRGFTDLQIVERAESWVNMGRPPEYLDLVDAIPALREVDRNWPDWINFTVPRVAQNADEPLAERALLTGRIEQMAPALGRRLAGLWTRQLGLETAVKLERYVQKRPEADDVEKAIESLMGIYAGGPLRQWDTLSAKAVRRLAGIAELVVERFPESPSRPAALVALALQANQDRDDKGTLVAGAADRIRAALEEVVKQHPSSEVFATAVAGLIRTDMSSGHRSRASARFSSFLDQHGQDPILVSRIREDLGTLALRLGGLPDFEAATLNGDAIASASLQGKVVVLDFWATWCGPCVEEFPTLRKIEKRHGEEVMLVGVNMDHEDALSTPALQQWLADAGVPGMHLRDGLSWESELVEIFGVKEIPFNVVVDPDGEVLAVNTHGRRLEKVVRDAARAAKAEQASAGTN